jgi:hypothetical protein
MPIMTSKKMIEMLKKNIAEIVADAIGKVMGDLHAAFLKSAERVVDKQKYKAMESRCEELLARNENLVQANATLTRRCIALDQILHGAAQDELRKSLAALADKIAVRAKIEGAD